MDVGVRQLNREVWPYRIKLGSDFENDITAIEIWLGQQFGTFRDRWHVVYQHNQTHFYFRNQQDAVLFGLKWS